MSNNPQPITTAPRDGTEIVIITHGGHSVRAKWTEGIAVDDDGQPVGCWAATTDDYPECWSDGVCWASNADEVASDPPVQWRSA